MPKRLRRGLAVVLLLFAVAIVALAVHSPYYVQLALLPFADIAALGDRTWTVPSSPEAARTILARDVAAARARVGELFGTRISCPPVIAGEGPETLERFAGTRGRTGVSRLTPFGSWIVVTSRGANVDVLAHEMTHVELAARLGAMRFERAVPTWFSEGLAMQVDHRSEYSLEAYEELKRKGVGPRPLRSMQDQAGFVAGGGDNARMAYIESKIEVGRWYVQAGRKGLLALIACRRARAEFQACYGVTVP